MHTIRRRNILCVHKIILDCYESERRYRRDNVKKKQLKHNKLWSLLLIAVSGGVFTLFLIPCLSFSLTLYLLTYAANKENEK